MAEENKNSILSRKGYCAEKKLAALEAYESKKLHSSRNSG